MAYLDSGGQDASPSFLEQLARSLGLGGSQPAPPDRSALASALAGQPTAPAGTHYAQLPGPPLLLPGGGDTAPVPAAAPGPAMPMRGSVADIPNSGAIQGPATIPAPPGPAMTASLGLPGQSATVDEDSDVAGTKVAQASGAPPAAAAPSVYEQTLKARFDQQEQIYNRANAQAAAAKTPEVARIYAQQAESAMAEANHINDELSASRKPGSHILSDAEKTPAQRAAGGDWQASAAGEVSQVSGTAGDTTRAPNPEEQARLMAAGQDPKNYEVKDGALLRIPGTEPRDLGKKEMRVIGQGPFGEQYGIFDPATGQVTPYTPPDTSSKAAIPAQIQELGLSTGEAIPGGGDKTPPIPLPPDQQARLAQVDPHITGTVSMILQGKMGLPKITAGRGNPLPLAITEAVYKVNPNFDANTNQTQLDTRKKFNTGGSNNTPGMLVLNSDAALDHMVPLIEASDALPNYGSLLGPGALAMERAAPGNILGEDFKKKVASLVGAATPASAETMKYLAGTTGGGEDERQQLIKSWADIGGSPASRRESAVKYIDDMLAKKQELQNQWHTAMDTPNGPHAPDFPVISDSARNSVIKMGYGDLLTKYGLQGNGAITRPPAIPTSPPPSQPKHGVYVPGKGIQWQ